MTAQPLYRVIYVSRSRIPPGERHTELARILSRAKESNARAGVTGALLFDRAGFAQALEGLLPAVSSTFECIQRDSRHGDVVVLESAAVEGRAFAGWTMAFAGEVAETEPGLDPASAEAARVLGLLRSLVGQTGAAAG
jgi:Sensors of blue-light using FAD